MPRRVLRFLLVLGLLPVSVVLTPLSAGAQGGVTVTVGADSVLLDLTLVRVPVEITCQPMVVYYYQSSGQLKQAVSKQLIATGTSYNLEDPIVCDGLPHPNSDLFWADL